MLRPLVVSLSLLLMFSPTAMAENETRYISDVQYVAIRATPSTNSSIVERGLKSGEAVEVLEQRGQFTKVQTASGNQGWLPNYFLMETPASRSLIDNLEGQLKQLQTDRDSLQQQLESLQSQHHNLQQQLSESETARTELAERLQSVDAQLADMQTWETSKQEMALRLDDVQQQLQKTQKAGGHFDWNWFLAGSVSVLIGILAGFILAWISRRKRS
ncbi:TIGR04211 family SH3 domain-containing protein [Balneatrix alpica]|uniref:TIGR04211 family SH3 domain-containing protein n=1 Tax=Balneatrix alpica TaxID=75684 RepID=A0ABV5ZG66_9GAMM|nr:TIGR04211 family SH3 domain-containing protein [Balneatrix alpica]